MKTLIATFTFLLTSTVLCLAQSLPIDTKTGKITYIKVVDAEGMTAKDLFKYSKEWGVAQGFKVKSEDAANGEVVFEGASKISYPGVKGKTETGNVTFTFFIFSKEGKYRYIGTDLVHVGLDKAPSGGKLEAVSPECGSSGMTAASWQLVKKKTQANMEALTADLERVIKEIQNDPAKQTDW